MADNSRPRNQSLGFVLGRIKSPSKLQKKLFRLASLQIPKRAWFDILNDALVNSKDGSLNEAILGVRYQENLLREHPQSISAAKTLLYWRLAKATREKKSPEEVLIACKIPDGLSNEQRYHFSKEAFEIATEHKFPAVYLLGIQFAQERLRIDPANVHAAETWARCSVVMAVDEKKSSEEIAAAGSTMPESFSFLQKRFFLWAALNVAPSGTAEEAMLGIKLQEALLGENRNDLEAAGYLGDWRVALAMRQNKSTEEIVEVGANIPADFSDPMRRAFAKGAFDAPEEGTIVKPFLAVKFYEECLRQNPHDTGARAELIKWQNILAAQKPAEPAGPNI